MHWPITNCLTQKKIVYTWAGFTKVTRSAIPVSTKSGLETMRFFTCTCGVPDLRNSGFGFLLCEQSIRIYFDRLQLKTLWCEPYAENPAPNRTLMKLGFEFI